jgi:hypothetical protein
VEVEAPQASALPRDQDAPFLQAFEAEMAKMLSSTADLEPQSEASQEPSEEARATSDREQTMEQPNPINPGEVLVNTIKSLVEGVSLLGMELKNAFPHLERNITTAQQQLPGHVDSALRGALQGLGHQMGHLATSMQSASEVTHQAAERTRGADLRAVEGAVEGLRGFVDGIGDMGRTLFTAFDAEFGSNASTAGSEPPIASRPAPAPPFRGPEESSTNAPASQVPASSESGNPGTVHNVPQNNLPKADTTRPASIEQDDRRFFESNTVGSTTHPQSRRVHRNIRLHPYQEPTASQPVAFDTTGSNRSRSPVSHDDVQGRFGRSRSPPAHRRPHPFDHRRRGHGWTHRRQDEIHHHGPPHHLRPTFQQWLPSGTGEMYIPPVYSMSSDVSTVAQPSMNPTNVGGYRPGPPPPVPRHPWSRTPHHPAHPAVRHRRSWYPGFVPDQPVTDSSLRSSVSFADLGNVTKSVPVDSPGPSRARRVRSVGSFHPKVGEDVSVSNDSRPRSTQAANDPPRQTNGSSAILDQDDADPTFSVRYPSLVANNDLRRAKTIASPSGKGNDQAPTLSHPSESGSHSDHFGRPPLSPESEMVRFPTLSQFEEQTHKDRLKSTGSKKPEEESPQSVPGSWPPQSEPIAESSGEFFARMTGLRAPRTEDSIPEPKSQLSRAKTVTASNPAARLLGPFDPMSNSLTATHQDEGLRRSATDRVANRRGFDGNRRPYSEHFSGDGRMGWESFLQQYEKTPGSFPKNEETDSQRQYPSLPKFEPTRRQTRPGRPSQHRPILRVETGRPNPRPREKTKSERCLDHLRMLGFGSAEDGGEERLVIYAEAADGNLEAAIEMIEEERKAYMQRGNI